MKRIIVLSVLLFLCACTLTINGNSITIKPEGVQVTLIPPTGTNTQAPTETRQIPTPTPQILRFITVVSGSNVRATPSISATVVAFVSTQTRFQATSQVAVSTYSWYQIRVGDKIGWVRSDRISLVENLTATPIPTPTPSPTIEASPTIESFPPLVIPFDGLNGYTEPSLNTPRVDLRLMPNDIYRVIGANSEFAPPNVYRNWYFICILASDRTGDCIQTMWVTN